MKVSIEGFNQKYILSLKKEVEEETKTKTIKIDCTDLVILRWFVDFYPKMEKRNEEGVEYAWVSYNKIIEDLPIIDISKRALSERLQKLVEFGILKYKLIKKGGTFTYYTFGDNYIKLVEGGCSSNDNGGVVQTTTKDKTIKNINNNKLLYSREELESIIKTIIDYLNLKCNKSYHYDTKSTINFIKARLKEGFTVEDFTKVIDIKCNEWLEDKHWSKFLRPETLFGTKFEGYLNQSDSVSKKENHRRSF